jgi:hypothetical protein
MRSRAGGWPSAQGPGSSSLRTVARRLTVPLQSHPNRNGPAAPGRVQPLAIPTGLSRRRGMVAPIAAGARMSASCGYAPFGADGWSGSVSRRLPAGHGSPERAGTPRAGVSEGRSVRPVVPSGTEARGLGIGTEGTQLRRRCWPVSALPHVRPPASRNQFWNRRPREDIGDTARAESRARTGRR